MTTGTSGRTRWPKTLLLMVGCEEGRCSGGEGLCAESGGPQVAIIMGSDSDLATMKAAADLLTEFGVACEVTIVSAHRTPDRMLEFARSAHSRGIKVGRLLSIPSMSSVLVPLCPLPPPGCLEHASLYKHTGNIFSHS